MKFHIIFLLILCSFILVISIRDKSEYEILSVNKNDEISIIKSSHRKLALKYHPVCCITIL